MTKTDTRISIEQIDEMCERAGVHRGTFWNYAMGEGQSAPLPREDVERMLQELADEG
jgi:hypothetical protein